MLKGETLSSKRVHFQSNGTSGEYPRVNQVAFQGWMKKLESTKDNAPLAWIRNMILVEPGARIKTEKLMSQILTCDYEKDYYGLCCDGIEETDVPAELRSGEIEDFSSSEGSSVPHPCKV